MNSKDLNSNLNSLLDSLTDDSSRLDILFHRLIVHDITDPQNIIRTRPTLYRILTELNIMRNVIDCMIQDINLRK